MSQKVQRSKSKKLGFGKKKVGKLSARTKSLGSKKREKIVRKSGKQLQNPNQRKRFSAVKPNLRPGWPRVGGEEG